VVQTVLNSSLRQSCSVFTNVTSALEVSLTDMRYINSRFTYLLTLLTYLSVTELRTIYDVIDIVDWSGERYCVIIYSVYFRERVIFL